MPTYYHGGIRVTTKIVEYDDYDEWKEEIKKAKKAEIYANSWVDEQDDDGYGGYYLEIYVGRKIEK